tara:strand:+ start:1297 stop:1674 length:378 start_codon:yes stop_codon:yes gene_type:complete
METNENRTVQERIEYQCEFVYKSLSVFLEMYTNKDSLSEDVFYSSQFNDLLEWYEYQQKFIPMIRHLSNEYDNNYKVLINELENLRYYHYLVNDSLCEGVCCQDSYKEVYNKFRISVNNLVSVYW